MEVQLGMKLFHRRLPAGRLRRRRGRRRGQGALLVVTFTHPFRCWFPVMRFREFAVPLCFILEVHVREDDCWEEDGNRGHDGDRPTSLLHIYK